MSITEDGPNHLTVSLTAAPASYTIVTRLFLLVASAHFADNAFDLAPSQHCTVTIKPLDEPISAGMVDVTWR